MKKRTYLDGCAVAQALDLVGDRWALPVIRELLLGPKRFSDIRAGLPGISANVLTQRLEELEAAGILVRRKLPPPASVQVYALTEWGAEAEDLFKFIGRWAARSPLMQPGLPMSVTSVIMSMRTMFSPEQAKDVHGRIGFRFGEEGFVATLDDGVLTVLREEPDDVDVLFSGDQNALAWAVYGGVPLAKLAGTLSVTGDQRLAERYLTLFPLPQKAELPISSGVKGCSSSQAR
jgi:DNA-binding HxlR family transcriptional regulator